VVFVAFDPHEPEEANAIESNLADVAEVRWLHEHGGDFANAPLEDVDALLCFGWPSGIEPHLYGMRRLRLVQRVPAGVEGIPFERLSGLTAPVQVASGSGSNAEWVAEHAMALLLTAAKRVAYHDRTMRRGEFHQTDVLSKELAESVLGVLGLGSIGGRVAHLGRAFGMRVQAIRRSKKPEEGVNVLGGLDALDRLLSSSDFVVVALPLTKETEGILDARAIQRMRSGAVLVNVARGGLIDEKALYGHLRLHPDFTAALDVWWSYPTKDGGFAQSLPFHELPNVVMTPHTAAMVPRWRERMVAFAAQNVRRFLLGKEVHNLVVGHESD
jgi:glycerate dehydrogenase